MDDDDDDREAAEEEAVASLRGHMLDHWRRYRNLMDEEGGTVDFPDFDVPGLDPVRRLLAGPTPPEHPPGGVS